MSAQPSASYAPEQEVRFAVVLYGGVSLAIYINGVAQELLCMVRATADLPEGETLSGSELIYRELGQILHRGGRRVTDKVNPNDLKAYPIRTRFVVDIISGSSAGGINGIALAKALALRIPKLKMLADVWREKADLGTLLNDKGSEPDKYPPREDNRTVSLINSERMYGLLLETLSDMNKDAPKTETGTAFADNLDLFVTATDLAGRDAPIQLAAQRINERIHKSVFHFEYVAPQDGGVEQNEFTADYDPMLAFSARCTSSFPVAFEPMAFHRIEGQVKRCLPELPFKALVKRCGKFFPRYDANDDTFQNRLFADGGYLDNRPFSYASEVIEFRSSTRPVERKLLFVDPFPERAAHEREMGREISFLENAMLAAMKLPRYEVIRGDIQTINAMNRQLYRLEALRDRIKTDAKHLPLNGKQPKSPDDFASRDLKDMVEGIGYGDKYPPYHHLRVYDVSDTLARTISCAAGFTVESDEYYFIRLLVRAWRDANYAAYREDGKQTENAFLDYFDIDYRARRLNHLRTLIDEKLQTELQNDVRNDLERLRAVVETQLRCLQKAVRDLQVPTDSSPFNKIDMEALKLVLVARYPGVMDELDRGVRYKAAGKVYDNLKSQLDDVVKVIRHHLEGVFQRNSRELKKVLASQPVTSERASIKKDYDLFHWHDALTLPVLQGTGAREYSEVAVFRVSPVDSELSAGYANSKEEKLAGIRAGAFGGFMDRTWRDNDMMWGRLDGAERIVTALLPNPADKALRERYIRLVHDEILTEEFATGGDSARDRIYQCLAYHLVKDGVTTATAEELIRHGDEVLKRFPSLADIINKGDFRSFLEKWYDFPDAPPNSRLVDWSARSLRIFSKMIDDLPGGKGGRASKRISRTLHSIGVFLSSLLRIVLPRSLPRDAFLHGLRFLVVVGGVFVVGGILLGFVGGDEVSPTAEGIRNVGIGVIVACIVAWLLLSVATRLITGRVDLSKAVLTLLSVAILSLAAFGGYKAWELGQGLLASF
ncbi:MAG: patatin-like protein [Kiloniellaceae bacterium]